jgi:hypothetical protein
MFFPEREGRFNGVSPERGSLATLSFDSTRRAVTIGLADGRRLVARR